MLILIGIALAFILYYARDNLQKDWSDLVEGTNITVDNFFYSFSPERSMPINIIDRQEKLKALIGEPFTRYKKPEWEAFWQVIYGVYPVEYSENVRLPPKSRQLTVTEMQEKLKEAFPMPFQYFQGQHWQEFWNIIFDKKTKQRM